MIEMLDGITLADYGLDLDDVGGPSVFDKATKKDKTELMATYIDYLKTLSAEFKETIEKSPELNALNKAIEFRTGILTGEIKGIVKPEDVQNLEIKAK